MFMSSVLFSYLSEPLVKWSSFSERLIWQRDRLTWQWLGHPFKLLVNHCTQLFNEGQREFGVWECPVKLSYTPSCSLIKNRLSLHSEWVNTLHCRPHTNEGQLNWGLILQCVINLKSSGYTHSHSLQFVQSFLFLPLPFLLFLSIVWSVPILSCSLCLITAPFHPFDSPSLPFSNLLRPSIETNFPSIITVLYDLV